MNEPDPDLDLLRSEAQFAQTVTRRAWAARLVQRIERLEAAQQSYAETFRYQTTHDSQESPDTDR